MGAQGEGFYKGGGKTDNTKTNANTNVNANKTNGYGGTPKGTTTGAGKTVTPVVTPVVTPAANTSAGYGGTIPGATTGAGTKAAATVDIPIYNSGTANKANNAGYYQGGGVTKISTDTPKNVTANTSSGYGGTPDGMTTASGSYPVASPKVSSDRDSATDANLMKQEQIDMRKKGIITNNIATGNEDKGDVGGQDGGTEDGTSGDWIGGNGTEDVLKRTNNQDEETITQASGNISTDSLISQLVEQLTGANSGLISPDVLSWAQAYAQALSTLGGTYDANVQSALNELKNKALKSGFFGQANYDMMVAKALQSGELEKNTAIANLAQELVGQSKEDAQNTIENWLNNKQITVNGLYDLLALVAKYNSTTEETTSGVDEEGNSYSRTTKTKTYM